MILRQKSIQPIATSHRLVAAGFRNLAEKQHVVLTLVISLSMIVGQIVVHRPPQRSFAKGNNLRQTLGQRTPAASEGAMGPLLASGVMADWGDDDERVLPLLNALEFTIAVAECPGCRSR
jgi:hypothetical protein